MPRIRSDQAVAAATAAAPDWKPDRPRTLVDHAVDVIVSAAARGLIIAGDRVSEPELAALLGMSRAPIREALRILESQGVTESEPYKGVRLMSVTPQRLEHLIDIRIPLETLACRRAIEARRNGPSEIRQLERAIVKLDDMRHIGDPYEFAAADTNFHRILCSFSANPVLSMMWESLARQITIVFGLTTFAKPMAEIVEEHRVLTEVFASGNQKKMEAALREHILDQVASVDFDRILALRRTEMQKSR